MTDNGNRRKKLNADHVVKIITEWDQKSIDDFAAEFEVASNTIRSMVYEIRKQKPDACPRKPKKGRADIVKEALRKIGSRENLEDIIKDV
jgi:hypothetical protein